MDTLAAYSQLVEQHELPTMRRGGYSTHTETLSEPDAVWAALAAQQPTQGWLQFQSRQRPFHDGLPQPEADWGQLLAAEAVTGEGHSLSLAGDGAGGFRLTRYTHSASGDWLCDELSQFAHDPRTGSLRYRRYWRLDDAQGYVQERACFIGFD